MIAAAVAIGCLAVGCSSERGVPGIPPSGPGSSPSTAVPSGTQSPAATSTPPATARTSLAPSSSVAPATGKTIDTVSLSLAVPTDFVTQRSAGNGLLASATLSSRARSCFISVASVADFVPTRFEAAAADAVKSRSGSRRLADRIVGGQRVFVIYEPGRITDNYTVGRVAGDRTASITFGFIQLTRSRTNSDRTGDVPLRESILASVRWKA